MKVISKTLFCISIYNFVFVNTSIANRATVPDQSIALNCKKDEVSHRDIDNLINNFWSKAADEGLAVSRIRNIPQYSNFNYGVHYTEDKNELLLNIVGMPEECSKKIKKGKLDSNDNTFSYKIEGKYEDLEKCMDEQFQLLICKHEKCVSKSKKPKKHVNNIDNDELAKRIKKSGVYKTEEVKTHLRHKGKKIASSKTTHFVRHGNTCKSHKFEAYYKDDSRLFPYDVSSLSLLYSLETSDCNFNYDEFNYNDENVQSLVNASQTYLLDNVKDLPESNFDIKDKSTCSNISERIKKVEQSGNYTFNSQDLKTIQDTRDYVDLVSSEIKKIALKIENDNLTQDDRDFYVNTQIKNLKEQLVALNAKIEKKKNLYLYFLTSDNPKAEYLGRLYFETNKLLNIYSNKTPEDLQRLLGSNIDFAESSVNGEIKSEYDPCSMLVRISRCHDDLGEKEGEQRISYIKSYQTELTEIIDESGLSDENATELKDEITKESTEDFSSYTDAAFLRDYSEAGASYNSLGEEIEFLNKRADVIKKIKETKDCSNSYSNFTDHEVYADLKDQLNRDIEDKKAEVQAEVAAEQQVDDQTQAWFDEKINQLAWLQQDYGNLFNDQSYHSRYASHGQRGAMLDFNMLNYQYSSFGNSSFFQSPTNGSIFGNSFSQGGGILSLLFGRNNGQQPNWGNQSNGYNWQSGDYWAANQNPNPFMYNDNFSPFVMDQQYSPWQTQPTSMFYDPGRGLGTSDFLDV